MPLTIKKIEAAKASFNVRTGKWSEKKLCDGEQLYLIAQRKHKAWRIRYSYDGQERTLTIGHYPAMSLLDAREKNRILKAELDAGHDPAVIFSREKGKILEENIEERRIEQNLPPPDSLGAIAEDWLQDVKKVWKPKTWHAEAKRIRLHLIKPYGHLHIKEVSAQEHIRPMFEALENAGKSCTLKKVAEKTVSIFNFAIALGKTENNPAYSIWKGLNFRKIQSKSLPSITETSKIGELLVKIDQYAKDVMTSRTRRSLEVCYASKILPYVFIRPSHLVEGEWSEIDWKNSQWNIPGERMKNGKNFVVPLSNQVISLLKELRGYTGQQKYIFHSSASKTGHITIDSITNVMGRIGYKSEMCGHGWRHAFVTNCKESLKYSSDIIFKQMSHTLEKESAKATYDKAEFLEDRRKMMQEYADFLDSLRKVSLERNSIDSKKAA